MHNLFIVWNDSDSLGIPIIDEQHRGIVSAINSLHYLSRTKYAKESLAAVVKIMHEYCEIHFITEEGVMARIGYPELPAHRALHERLLRKSIAVGYESVHMNDPTEYLNFLKDWWLNHIGKQDRLYAPYAHEYMAAH